MIADHLSVSKALVSKALSNNPSVNENTRRKILETSKELGYMFRSNKNPFLPKSINLGVLMPRAYLNDFEYWGQVISGIDKEISNRNCTMIFSGIDLDLSQKEGIPSSIYENKMDGAIVLGQLPDIFLQALQTKRIPIVMVDSNMQHARLDHVLSNNYAGAYHAVTFLLEAGHRHAAYVGDANSAWSFSERLRGFSQAVKDYESAHRVGIKTTVIEGMGASANGMYTTSDFAQRLKRFVSSNEPFTALFCANDLIAFQVMNDFQDWGIKCPEDISIIGFDNLQSAEMMKPPLTTVSVPKTELGSRAVELMIRRLENPQALPELIQLSTQFIERFSVKAVSRQHKN